MVVRSIKARFDEIEQALNELRDKQDEHEGRLRDLERKVEGLHSALDEFRGYRDMTRDELLRIQGQLRVHEQTLDALIEWATTEDCRETMPRIAFHDTRSSWRTVVLSQRWTIQATTSSKSRVWRASWRAHGTASVTTR